MLNDIDFFTNTEEVDLSISDAKSVFGENDPYTTEMRLGGNVIMLSEHFREVVPEALTTGCMVKMSQSEKTLMFHYIEWQSHMDGNGGNDDGFSTIQKDALLALNKWIIEELTGGIHESISTCES